MYPQAQLFAVQHPPVAPLTVPEKDKMIGGVVGSNCCEPDTLTLQVASDPVALHADEQDGSSPYFTTDPSRFVVDAGLAQLINAKPHVLKMSSTNWVCGS